MAMTRGGVFYNLHESIYRINVYGLDFVFSSVYNLGRFHAQLHDFTEAETKRVEKMLGVTVNDDVAVLAAAKLYSKIETRGFLVMLGDTCITSMNDFAVNMQVVPARE